MKRQRIAVALVLLAVAVPLVGLLVIELRLRGRLAQRPEVGTVFPALPPASEGQFVSDTAGRRQIVIFAKASCSNCDRTIATLARLAPKEDFKLVAVIAGSEVAVTNATALRVIPDPGGDLARRFGVIKVPLVFVLDAESRVQATVVGKRPEAIWRSVLAGDELGL